MNDEWKSVRSGRNGRRLSSGRNPGDKSRGMKNTILFPPRSQDGKFEAPLWPDLTTLPPGTSASIPLSKVSIRCKACNDNPGQDVHSPRQFCQSLTQDSRLSGNYPVGMGPLTADANGKFDWDRQLRWLRPVVAARIGEPDGVDEVLQDIAMQTIRRPEAWANVVHRPGWLYRVAIRQCLLYRRRHGRQRRLLNGYSVRSHCAKATAMDPLDWLLAGERQAQVRQATARLPSKDAELLALKYAENLSYAQIAEHMGISTSAVEARLHRARERLRRELHHWTRPN
jgi:RNA polymerase sigma factor (sigma-70 family)